MHHANNCDYLSRQVLPIHRVPSYSNNYQLHTIPAFTEAAPLWDSARRLVSFAVTTFQAANLTN